MAKVTLTFDNGPEPSVTPEVLACLARHTTPATFFVLGSKADPPEGRALVRAAVESGHRVGNHTWSHSTPLGELPATQALEEFDRTAVALAWIAQQPPLFRPFGGAGRFGKHLLHPAVVERLVAQRYTCVLWNSVPGDWRDPEGWCDKALRDIATRPWSVLVLHDLPNGAMRHLDRFLDRLKEAGHELTADCDPACTPIVEGRIVGELEPLVAGSY